MKGIEQTLNETKNPLKVLEDFNEMMTSLKEYLPAGSYATPKPTPWKVSY